jgi:glycosyltransferase involved in cell wall biosynthesis
MSTYSTPYYQGRLGLQQRVLPEYRKEFVELLATACKDGLSVFAGKPAKHEHINAVDYLNYAELSNAKNLNLFQIGTSFYQCWQLGLIDWLENWQPDILIVESNPRYRSTRRAINWMHKRDRPVLGWGLGAPEIKGKFTGWRYKERERFLNTLDGLIAYSQRGAQEYRSMGIPEGRIFISPNATSPKPISNPPQRPPEFENQPIVLFVGRLQERKRIDLLLSACEKLPLHLQPKLWIIGDGPERQNLEQLAEEIYPKTEFLGALFGSELDTLFDAADLFVLPGTGGLAVQQAMAHALPVVVATGDGTQDDLVRSEPYDEAHRNGWSIPTNDLDALTNTLLEALEDPQSLRRMGDNSFRIVSEEINIQAMVSVFVHAINTMISGSKE